MVSIPTIIVIMLAAAVVVAVSFGLSGDTNNRPTKAAVGGEQA
jgi:hypothetical protein